MPKRKREILDILQAVVWYSWEIKIDEVERENVISPTLIRKILVIQ